MNYTHDGKKYGFTQYRAPLAFDLYGREFQLCSPAADYALRFDDRGFVTLGESRSYCETLKNSNDLYICIFGERLSYLVLDLEAGTAVLKREPETETEFLTVEGCQPAALPGLTEEMGGTAVRWNFGCGRFLEHVYHEDGSCTCVWSPRADKPKTFKTARYYKIRDSFYLVELDAAGPFNTDIPVGYSTVVLLQDYDRLVADGLVYSPALNDCLTVSAYGTAPQVLA